MKDALQHALDVLSGFLAENPLVGAWYTTVVRFVFPLLALMILVGAIRSLWKVKHPDEVWGYLTLGNGVRLPLTHWENIIGRAAACDVQLEYPSVSRQHAALIRENDGSWTVYDLNSKGGIKVNDLPVDEYAIVEDGDTVSFGGIPTTMVPISAEEKRWQMAERREEGRPAGMWGSLVLLTLFQVLTAVQLVVAGGGEANVTIPLTFFVFTCVCWGYFIFMRLFRRIGFEMETIAFFLCTLSLAVTGSTVPDELPKQLIAIFMGMTMFLILGFFLRDLTRAQKVRWFMGATAVGLLAITLLIGSSEGGAKAWLRFGSLSLQTSEIAKICYIFAGAATLDRLFNKRNLWMFIGLTGVCGGCLALQNDFGTALVFFVTFLVIAYLRSGDFATLGLVCAGCFGGRHGHADHQAARCGALRVVGSHLGGRLRQGLPADSHADGGGLGRPHWRRRRQGLALRPACGGYRHRFRHAVRGVGSGHRGADRTVHYHARGVRGARLPRRPFELLHHRGVRRDQPARVPDLSERVRRGRHSAVYRRHPAVRVQRRLVHAVGMGHARLPQGDGHPSERFVRGAPAKPPRAERGGLSHA